MAAADPKPSIDGFTDAVFLAKCAEFGRWLTAANLDAHLAALPRTRRRRYREARARLLQRLNGWL